MKEEKKEMKITKYNQDKAVRVSQDLYQLGKIRWRMSTLAYRLLFALSQCLEYRSPDLFPELGFDKQTLFKYMGLENNKDCYNRLAETLNEIMEKPLKIAQPKKRGGYYWAGYAWISSYYFSTNEKFVTIRLNDDVKPFLLNLKQYASIQPKYYIRLSTEYQNWFYPYLKNAVKLGQWRVSIDNLKLALSLDENSSYDPTKNKNATENILKYVVGIQISEEAKQEQRQAKAAGRSPRPVAWNYYVDKKTGETTGTLYGITANTDINVSACAVKTGRTYADIIFFISMKKQHLSKAQKMAEVERNNAIVDYDLVKPKDKRKRSNNPASMQDLFAQIVPQEADINPAYIPDVPKPKVFYYSKEEIEQVAKDGKMPFSEAVKRLRLETDEQGRYYKTI